jgi:hypothetical protein
VFNVHVQPFLDGIWGGLRDPKLHIREASVQALEVRRQHMRYARAMPSNLLWCVCVGGGGVEGYFHRLMLLFTVISGVGVSAHSGFAQIGRGVAEQTNLSCQLSMG